MCKRLYVCEWLSPSSFRTQNAAVQWAHSFHSLFLTVFSSNIRFLPIVLCLRAWGRNFAVTLNDELHLQLSLVPRFWSGLKLLVFLYWSSSLESLPSGQVCLRLAKRPTTGIVIVIFIDICTHPVYHRDWFLRDCCHQHSMYVPASGHCVMVVNALHAGYFYSVSQIESRFIL